MRRDIYLTQDEIDEKVQKMSWTLQDYNKWRAFQDGDIGLITTPFEIYRRKGATQ